MVNNIANRMARLGWTFLILVAVAFITVDTFAQADARISTVRNSVASINRNARAYKRVTRTVEGISLEGAEATYLLWDGKIKKINVKIFGETFRATAELFYEGGVLIFAFQRLEGYDTHIAADPPPKVNKVVETRVYYSAGKAFRVIEGTKPLPSKDSNFRGAEEGINDLSEKLAAALNS